MTAQTADHEQNGFLFNVAKLIDKPFQTIFFNYEFSIDF